jgi:hypothetical protein
MNLILVAVLFAVWFWYVVSRSRSKAAADKVDSFTVISNSNTIVSYQSLTVAVTQLL